MCVSRLCLTRICKDILCIQTWMTLFVQSIEPTLWKATPALVSEIASEMQDITVPAEAWQTAIDKAKEVFFQGRTGLVRSVGTHCRWQRRFWMSKVREWLWRCWLGRGIHRDVGTCQCFSEYRVVTKFECSSSWGYPQCHVHCRYCIPLAYASCLYKTQRFEKEWLRHLGQCR